MKRLNSLTTVFGVLLALLLAACQNLQPAPPPVGAGGNQPVATGTPLVVAQATSTRAIESTQTAFAPKVEVVASGLEVPWAFAFADRVPGADGKPQTGTFIFLTERPGRLRLIRDGQLLANPVATPPVLATGEGGLTGLALDPEFAANGWLYVMYTYRASDGPRNRVSRFTVRGAQAGEEKVLIDGIPGAGIHDGGALAFGPDGKLYVGTGDASNGSRAQDLNDLAGKVLRLNPDGSLPSDNPFPRSPVYTYGNRNPQGFAWQPGTGQFFEVEHGPSGSPAGVGAAGCCHDEVNRIVAGGNYGWPVVAGAGGAPKYVDPVLESGATTTWAPSGAAFYTGSLLPAWQGDLFFAALRGQHLHRVRLGGPEGATVAAQEELFANQYGRLRGVRVGPDGALYFATSNRDGRGRPAPEDDRLLRITSGP